MIVELLAGIVTLAMGGLLGYALSSRIPAPRRALASSAGALRRSSQAISAVTPAWSLPSDSPSLRIAC